MTNWEQIARQRERVSAQADTGLKALWARIQTAMWPEMDVLIGSMATDKAGRITFTLANMQKAQRVGLRVSAVWKRTFAQVAIDFVISAFRRLLGLNAKYMRQVAPNVTQRAEDLILKRVLSYYGYQDGQVISGTLFDALNPDRGLSAEIARRVQTAVAAKMPLEQFRAQFRADFINPTSGFAARYYRRWTNDIFMQFDRGVGLAYAEELGLKHAIYAGTMKDNTRDFCEARLNRVYTRETIAAWNRQQWNGKHRDIPVELACGGYNCRHTLNYISPELAAVVGEQRGGIDTYNQISQS